MDILSQHVYPYYVLYYVYDITKVGIATAVTAAVVSIPMIFDINTVMYFNEIYVTSDVPDAKDLETPLEVGSWAW